MPKRLLKILTLFLAVAACIVAAGCAPRFSWSNPIAIGDDGIYVLDIDPKTGAATEIKWPTWGRRSVKTGR